MKYLREQISKKYREIWCNKFFSGVWDGEGRESGIIDFMWPIQKKFRPEISGLLNTRLGDFSNDNILLNKKF